VLPPLYVLITHHFYTENPQHIIPSCTPCNRTPTLPETWHDNYMYKENTSKGTGNARRPDMAYCLLTSSGAQPRAPLEHVLLPTRHLFPSASRRPDVGDAPEVSPEETVNREPDTPCRRFDSQETPPGPLGGSGGARAILALHTLELSKGDHAASANPGGVTPPSQRSTLYPLGPSPTAQPQALLICPGTPRSHPPSPSAPLRFPRLLAALAPPLPEDKLHRGRTGTAAPPCRLPLSSWRGTRKEITSGCSALEPALTPHPGLSSACGLPRQPDCSQRLGDRGSAPGRSAAPPRAPSWPRP